MPKVSRVALMFLSITLIFLFPFYLASAEEKNTKDWFSGTLQPMIETNEDKINKSWEENWNLNLSTYLINGGKKETVNNLKELGKEIKNIKKDIKETKVPKGASKEQKKHIKNIKRHLNKSLTIREKQVKKLTKYIDKGKEFKSTKKYDKKIKKSDKHIKKANTAYASLQDLGKKSKEIQLHEIETIDEEVAQKILDEKKLKEEMEKAEKVASEEKMKKETEEYKEQEDKKLEELEKTKEEKRKNFNKTIDEFIKMGQGAIVDIKPYIPDDWSVTYIYVDNSWHLLTEEEKKYVAETIGSSVENAVIQSSMDDYTSVYFVDQNGNKVASPKMFGGYKIKK